MISKEDFRNDISLMLRGAKNEEEEAKAYVVGTYGVTIEVPVNDIPNSMTMKEVDAICDRICDQLYGYFVEHFNQEEAQVED